MHRFFASLINQETRFARWSMAIWLLMVFVLGAVGFFDPVKELLDSEMLTLKVGTVSFSVYKIIKIILALLVVFWLASVISAAGERHLKQFRHIKASNRALMIKGFQIGVYFLMLLFGLDVIGIDLTAFAVVGGAVGIGIGFGLQKITSNFISGLILLFEKSVEEDDLVEMDGGVYGIVKHTGARYTLIETFDGKEVMIPNEDFITNRVTNWTFSNKKGRVEVTLGVSYDCDIELARTLILDAAIEHERCSKDPEPQCYLTEFGDNSVNFLLYFWVDDVTEGRFEPKSDVMRSIWRKFKENNIGIPYPQRDIHIKNPEVLK